IAMRDLELRGAGNLLGTAQSGHIMAVGFDLYCKLLKQAVETLKTGRRFQRLECAVRLDFVARGVEPQPGMAAASLPASYVADARARIACHRQLAEAETEAAVEAVVAEWKDRFGPLPPPARNLVLLARLARLGARRGLAAIESREGRLLLQRRKGGYVQPGGRFPRLESANADSRLREVVSLVEKLAQP
ncbi:MAG: hypothetical protein N2322_04770, partial [Terrimicrobiaceae bacterium]|nr:hypothetical protein [Terrimicrobiaceae bacterium]